ncbi:MAG: hypothetical protein AVDCRST_MAG59-986, partial [uncultured Thermomicrobiales bacterium]
CAPSPGPGASARWPPSSGSATRRSGPSLGRTGHSVAAEDLSAFHT